MVAGFILIVFLLYSICHIGFLILKTLEEIKRMQKEQIIRQSKSYAEAETD